MLRAGVAERVITPPLGVPMGGYAGRPGPARGVHDDLHARALYLELGGEAAVLVSLELLYPAPELVEAVRGAARRELGVPGDAVMVSAVHTHSGPSMLGLDSELDRGPLEDYWRLVPALVASAVVEARERAAGVRVRAGAGRLDGWTVNRRRPQGGPLDNEVPALLFEGAGGPVAAGLHFACHAVVLGHNNLLISADYPGAASRAFERLTGAKALFLTGACGDINPLTPGTLMERVYDRTVGTFVDAEEMGTAVACEAVKSLMGQRPREVDRLAAARRTVELELQRIPEVRPGEVAALEEELRKALAEGRPAEQLRWKLGVARWAAEVAAMLRRRAPSGRLATEVQAIRVGGAAIVGLPGEPLVELGLEVKAGSPLRPTLVAGYTNDAIGYVPTDAAYDEGGYEVTPPACVVARGSAGRLVRAALSLLGEL